MYCVDGTCTVDLISQPGGEKLEMRLDCPSCQFSQVSLQTLQTCNIYKDLEFDEGKKHEYDKQSETHLL